MRYAYKRHRLRVSRQNLMHVYISSLTFVLHACVCKNYAANWLREIRLYSEYSFRYSREPRVGFYAVHKA